jgi:hypothetical protein
MHKFYGAFCILLGLAMAAAGYWMLRPYERSKDSTGFAGPIFNRHLVIATVGNLLVILGLIVAVIFGFIFFRT